MRRSLSALLAALFTLLALVLGAAPAAAHAELTETAPTDGRVLSNAPKAITLRFNKSVETTGATIRVLDMAGVPLAGIGSPAHEGGDPQTLSVQLPAGIGTGTQAVVYRIVSADGHPIQGQFSFSVGVMTASTIADRSGGQSGGIEPALAVARWGAFAGLALLIGTALLLALAWPAGVRHPAVQRLIYAGTAVLIVSTSASLLLHGPFVLGKGFSSIWSDEALQAGTDSRVGRLLIARIALLGAVLLTVGVVARLHARGRLPAWADRTGVRGGAVLAVAVGFGLTWSLAVHTAGGGQLVSLPVDLVHLVAMGAWLGGLPALLLMLRAEGSNASLVQRAVPTFSRVATVSVIVLLVTGVLQAWRQVGSFDALFGTAYGGWLLAKLTLVVGLLGLGAAARSHQRRIRDADVVDRRRVGLPKLPNTGLGRVVAVETAVGVVVLGVTAALVGTQPAAAAYRSEQAANAVKAATSGTPVASPVEASIGFRFAKVGRGAEPASKVVPVGTAGSGAGWVQAVISPAVGGLPNELHLSVLGPDGLPLSIPSALVDLRLPGRVERSSQFPLRGDGAGHFNAPFTLPAPGSFELGVIFTAKDGTKALVLVPFDAK
ncbi:MAG: copper resistance CopC/CopD family protein [Sporichthyaceae bacterium]